MGETGQLYLVMKITVTKRITNGMQEIVFTASLFCEDPPQGYNPEPNSVVEAYITARTKALFDALPIAPE